MSLVVSPGDNNNYFSVNNDYNVGLELRSGSSGGTPYIDFSNDASSDYDGRIILNGSVLQVENPSAHDVLFLKSPNGTIDLYVDSPGGNSLGVYSTTAGAHARISASDFRLISDIRLKKNVETLTGVLGRLDAVRGVSFDLIKGDDKRSIGVIAQELETVFPELVTKSKNGKDGLTDERFVSYGGLSAVNLQGLKELKAVVLAQAEEIKALKQRLDVLEKK